MTNRRPNPYMETLILTAITVGVALLMQSPALRQRLVMRVSHGAKTFCQAQADLWAELAAKAATAYNRARL
jgi:hypothetical protein